MSKVQLIAVDMDGTLLDRDHVTVPERNIKALQAASERGVAIAIASGRTWSLISDAVEQLGLMDYAVIANGAAVRDVKHHQRIYEKSIANAQALEMARAFHRFGLPFELYCAGQNMVERGDYELVKPYCITPESVRIFETKTEFVDDFETALAGRNVEKFNLFDVPGERTEAVLDAVRAIGPVAVANSFKRNMEFAAQGVSKGTALAALAEHMGITAESVMAFGDAGNDLEMLAWAGWSFAMENGSDEAKAAAKYRAANCWEAGVGRAVEEYVLKGAL